MKKHYKGRQIIRKALIYKLNDFLDIIFSMPGEDKLLLDALVVPGK